MLQVLREKASSWVIKILLGLLIVAFAIWGINDVFLGERDPVVAKVGKVKIVRSEFTEELRNEMNRLRRVLGTVDEDTAFRMGLHTRVLDRMINRVAITLATEELGVLASDQMVGRAIRLDPSFAGSDGKFSRLRFHQALNNANMAESYYVHTLRQSLAAQQLNAAASANVPVPKALIDPLTRFRSEQRVAKTLLVSPPPLGEAKEPKPEELGAFYKDNTQQFMAPEFREVTFVHLDPRQLAKEIQVSDARIADGYAARKDTEFTIPDRRKVTQVVFQTEAAAQAASAAVKSGKKLADVAKEKGKTLKPVNLGWIEKKDLVGGLAEPVFKLAKGTVSDVLKSPLGWHIVVIDDVQMGRVKPLAEVRTTVRDALALADVQKTIGKLSNTLEDALAGGADIKAAAAQLNIKAITVPALDAQGRDRAGKAVANLPIGGNFLRTAFEVQEGELSQLTDTDLGGAYILIVNKVTPPQARPLTEVRSVAVMTWKATQQAKVAETRAKAILERLKKGDKIDAVAKAEKLQATTSKPFTRLSHEAESGVPAALAEKLFTLKTGEAAMAESAKGYVVGVLSSISAGAGKEKSAIEKSSLAQIRQGIAADFADQLVDAVRKRFTVEIYTERLRERI